MALPLHALKILAPLLKGEVLSLGYPDLDATAAQVESLFGYKPTRFTKAHQWHGRTEPLPETEELFEHLDAKLTVVDFVRDRGMERIANLNEPQDLGQFDLVIDPGTLEHCFNIGVALMNAANAVKLGGHILHLSPMNMPNHGFYNLSPTLYHDFYSQNGWSAEVKVIARPFQVSPTERFVVAAEYLLRCLAQKHDDNPLKMPIQTKYLKKARK
jgi:hypothetical protein